MAAKPERDRTSDPTHASEVLRFEAGERYLHWALAVPFVVLYLTAGLMALLYWEPYPRPFREAVAIAHRVVGLLLIVLPPIALLAGRSHWRVHLENMREGWRWTLADLRWLVLFPVNAVNPRVELPEEGKFNAAEKLNFMMVSLGYPLYIVTGVLVWLPGVAFTAYLAHFAMAVIGLPLVLGHIFMATVAPSTRVGLSGMVTGWVDRNWARHHYRRWYRAKFESGATPGALSEQLERAARIRCGTCSNIVPFRSWEALFERLFQLEPIVCPGCDHPLRLAAVDDDQAIEAFVSHLRLRGADEPIEGTAASTACPPKGA